MQDFLFYFSWGWEHIISKDALDHQLFIAALAAIYLLKDWKQVLVLITAFTIGHAITLGLSVYDLVRFDTKWVEFLIPCTIVITAISNLFQKKFTPRSIRINYFLALGFGLIHGMGYANTLRWTIAPDQNLALSFLGFNVGLEVGQIILVIGILLLGQVAVSLLKINRREWVIFLSGLVLGLALKMTLERLPIKKKTNEETSLTQLHVADDGIHHTRAKHTKQSQLRTC